MTSPAIDLDNLRDMIGHDAELERELIEIFRRNAADCLRGLETATDNDGWRRHAHAFKGAALNLGAGGLGSLCLDAQLRCDADADAKAAMLKRIAAEHRRVLAELDALAAG